MRGRVDAESAASHGGVPGIAEVCRELVGDVLSVEVWLLETPRTWFAPAMSSHTVANPTRPREPRT